MTIVIQRPGLLTTVQDTGRFGYQKFGIIVSGAMDTWSLRIANLLVGNKENEGALEITLVGPEIEFKDDQLIAITGGNLEPKLDGKKVPMWRPVLIQKGAVLKFKGAVTGSRAYIAFAGGLEVPIIMNSKSTYLKAGIGGVEGRPLQKKDQLNCGKPSEISKSFMAQLQKKHSFSWFVKDESLYHANQAQTIRVLKGSEYNRFKESSHNDFLNDHYTITPESDRMGYRIKGTPLALIEKFELLSEAVTFGTIQVPANGQPIVLMADRQTTGGYPKIGQVISADLPKLAQLQSGQKIRFELISMAGAEAAFIQEARLLQQVAISIRLKAR